MKQPEIKKEFITLPLGEIIPYERNPRINDEAVKDVIASIEQCNDLDPIEIDEDNIILSGHTRLKALVKLGYKTADCLRYTGLTEIQKRKYRLLANKTGEKAQWDPDLLPIELDGLDFEGYDFGFDMPEFTDGEPIIVEDEPPEEEETETLAHSGDIWILGNHRLFCGDCTVKANLDMLMNGKKADLYLTDPPYNVNYEGGTGKKIENDNMDSVHFQEFLYDAFTNAYEHMKKGAAFYIWYASREVVNFVTALERANLEVRQELIWNKNSLVLGRQDYQWKHEPCLYGWKDGASHYFVDNRKLTTVIPDPEEIDPRKMKKEELVELVEKMFERLATTVIDEKRPTRSEDHPTMKPIRLVAKQVYNSTRTGDIVLDTFGGSGSTLIACEQLGRSCYTSELSTEYADVIIQRYINFVGDTGGVYVIRNGEQISYDDAAELTEPDEEE